MKYPVLIVSLLSTLLLSAPVPADDHERTQKAILITGATTGIGRATAEHLAAEGYFVYAGARKDADMEALNKIENVMAVRLDVTNQDQIDDAAELIRDQGRGLWGLVNNAGVGFFAPLTEAKVANLELTFDVNVFGVFRVTQAFAPLIIESKGRIVNISSVSGVLSVGTAGTYAASKHALEAMTDALAEELWDLGVHVAAVNPGAVATEIGTKDCRQLLDDSSANWGHFEARRQEMIDRCKKRLEPAYDVTAADPIAIALVIEQALFEEKPRGRYLVASQGGAGETIAWIIREMLALNIGHEQSYTRDEIVRFIDLQWPYMTGEKVWNSQEEEWKFHADWAERKLPETD